VTVVGGFLLGRWFTLNSLSRAVDWAVTVSGISDVAQVVGLIVGGAWAYRLFVRQRTEQPSLEITHELQAFRLDEGKVLIRVSVALRNVSKVLLSPRRGELTLDRSATITGDSISWGDTLSRKFDFRDYDLLLEPGESHRYAFDIVVPSSVGLVRVRTEIRERKASEEFWDSNSLHAVVPLDVGGVPALTDHAPRLLASTAAGAIPTASTRKAEVQRAPAKASESAG
jgi:hypothetical protein